MLAIRHYRLKRGWSQGTLGGLVGVDKACICKVESGRLKLSEDLLGRLATALNVSPAFTLLRPVVVHEQVFIQGSDERVAVSDLEAFVAKQREASV